MQIDNLLELKSVCKSFTQGQDSYNILHNVNLVVNSGEIISIIGQSGSGKSTLLHLLGLIDLPNSGSILVDGVECSSFCDDSLTEMRRKYLGFVYQFHHLLPEFSAIDNLKVARMIGGDDNFNEDEFIELLKKFGLEDKAKNYPSQLSGGERQRVAIARAMVNNPKIILADEPTGNLDQCNAEIIFTLLLENVKKKNIAAVIVTHNMELAKKTDKMFLLSDGKLELIT